MVSPHPVNDGSESEMELEEDELPKQAGASLTQTPDTCDEIKWNALELDQKCKDVMNLLADKKLRWSNDSGNPNIPILEEYKKIALTRRDPRDKTLPTALHILARNYTKDFAHVPTSVRETVIKYLLEQGEAKSSSDPATHENTQEQPILHVAMTFENDDFIDCVERCWPQGFPDLLHAQDGEEKNCLHHVFALPSLAETRQVKQISAAKTRTLQRAQKLVPKAKPETLAAKDKSGNTPIHYALDYRQCFGRKRAYVELVQDMVRKGDKAMNAGGSLNNDGESPIIFCQRTMEEYKAWQQARKSQSRPSPTVPQTIADKQDITAGKGQVASQGHGKDKEATKDPGRVKVQIKTQNPKGKVSHVAFEGLSEDRETWNHTGSDPTGGFKPPLIRRESQGKLIPGTQFRNSNPDLGSPTVTASSQTLEIKSDAALPNKEKTDVQNSSDNSKMLSASAGGEQPVNDILDFLRLHYIRTRPDLEARDLIDGKDASDKNLYFDALGHKRTDTIIKLIDRMAVGGFDETLSYVYLPIIEYSQTGEPAEKPERKTHAMNQGVARHKALQENPKIGRTAHINVFERLYKAGVRSILRLHVEDREYPSHTDATIEMALRGRDSLSEVQKSRPISVETWDWRKADLSTDVIAFAAPTVEQVNLYWSGNQTVLRGWSCPEGIPRLHAATKQRLHTVIVHAAPGLETRDRMDKMLSQFKRKIENDTDNKVEVKFVHRMNGLFTKMDFAEELSDSAGGNSEGERQHIWVKKMEEFRSALNSIHTALTDLRIPEPEMVKVALIDDGVDLEELDNYYNRDVNATGRSYYPPDDKSERPWHRSSGGHGTIMANMILRVNPWVSLHVMKLQDGPSNDGGRTIFAESAAKAIRGAISRNVDIISMSWTVKQKVAALRGSDAKPSEAGPVQMLEDAINAAAQKGTILMFCSASDDLQAGGMDSLPYRRAPGHIFRIGAALSYGQRDAQTEDIPNIDYFFPGNQVAEPWNPKKAGTIRYHDGSSVSTALAAGLASLIIYCAIIMRTYWKAKKNEEKYKEFESFAVLLRDRTKMKRAFDNIRSTQWTDSKYLPVWDVFGPATENIVAEKEGAKKVEMLGPLVMDLCSKLNSR